MALKWLRDNEGQAIIYTFITTVENNGDTLITLDQAYIKNIDMLDVYRNGVFQEPKTLLHEGIWWEDTETTIKFEDNYLKKDDVLIIRYRASDINIGDVKVVGTVEALDGLPQRINQVAIVTDKQRFYIYTQYGWIELGSMYSTNGGAAIQYEKINVIDYMERTYNCETLTYNVGTHNLIVFLDGEKIDPFDYIEVGSNTITFLNDLPPSASELEFISFNTDSWENLNEHNVEYYYTMDGLIETRIIKVNDITIETKTFEYDTNLYLVKEITEKNDKTIEKSFIYDLSGNIIEKIVNIT